MTTAEPSPPPGTNGLPLLGETLPFVRDIFGFIHQRTQRHGPVFRTRILGKPTVFISGPQTAEKWLDTRLIERHGAFPPNVLQLFGGDENIVPMLDGEAHQRRKRYLLSAFSAEAVAGYLPLVQRNVERVLEKWAGAGETAITPDLKALAIETICGAVLDLKPGPELDQLLADYRQVMLAFASLPINLPGTAYRTGLKARDRVLAALEAQVAAHAQRRGDGLSRILSAAEAAGEPISVRIAAREMHHFVLAGVIIFAELVAIVLELDRHPEVRQRLAQEIARAAPSGPVTHQQLREMPYLMQVVNEVKRTCPNVPMSFGRARAPVDVGGYRIPAGWLVMMAVVESNRAPIFTDPEKFDPERFSAERGEQKRHPHAFMPQGAGELSGHK
ncbi:MAG TPA: cytochrome P450, partial [Myxococcaceae bacterium]|nr:cytochrome P450 [Myxococcaceae bacterium]